MKSRAKENKNRGDSSYTKTQLRTGKLKSSLTPHKQRAEIDKKRSSLTPEDILFAAGPITPRGPAAGVKPVRGS